MNSQSGNSTASSWSRIGHDETPGEMPGMYRNGQNHVGNVYLPPDQGDVPALMRHFSRWLQAPGDVHPAIVAGIAHLELVAIHPFWDGNGRVSRALATLVLQRSAFGFKKLLSFEKYLWTVRDEYFNAIERSLRGSYVEGYDATPWLEFWIGAIVAHTRGLADSLTDWRRMMDDAYRDLAQLDLNHRQVDALIYAIRAGRLTRSDYIEIAKVSPMTASRDLRDLADRGLLTAQGRTRDRVYLYVRGRPAAGVTPENQGCCSIPGRDKGNGAARVRTRGALRLRFARRRVGPPSRA